ncbi:MAG: hypothetical protein Q4G21_07595 [Dermabacter sp.]|nr:hypothetical protein [Dermabacter sp.]
MTLLRGGMDAPMLSRARARTRATREIVDNPHEVIHGPAQVPVIE